MDAQTHHNMAEDISAVPVHTSIPWSSGDNLRETTQTLPADENVVTCERPKDTEVHKQDAKALRAWRTFELCLCVTVRRWPFMITHAILSWGCNSICVALQIADEFQNATMH